MLFNIEKYYDKILPEASELNNNEIRRIFNKYDEQGIGFISKDDIQYVFLDIKRQLEKNEVKLNEKIFVNKMLHFYTGIEENCEVDAIKKCFSEIINAEKDMTLKNSKRIISNLDYLKKISDIEIKKGNVINDYLASNKRNDIYPLKTYGNKEIQPCVILNENKLQSKYK